MPRATHLVTNCTAGELSPKLDIRVDLKRYANGMALIRNAIVMPHGGARKRPGTIHIQEIKDSDTSVPPLLVSFEFNVEQAYEIEFGDQYVRFFKDRAIITDTPKVITNISQAATGVVTIAGHGYSNGDQVLISGVTGMVQVNNRRFAIGNVATDTFELTGVSTTSYGAYSGSGTAAKPIEVATTYTAAQLDDLSFTQSADTLFISHKSHPLRRLTRSSHTSWTLTEADIKNGPFRAINTDTTHYLSVAVNGSDSINGITRANPGVVTANGHPFAEGATVTITGVGGMTQVNNQTYVARNVTTNTFELWTNTETRVNTSAFGTYTSGGTATTAFTLWGTVSPGSRVTLTSTDSFFTADHVGALFRLWEPGKGTGVGPMPTVDRDMSNGQQVTNDGKVYGVNNFSGQSQWQAEFSHPAHEEGVVNISTPNNSVTVNVVYLHASSCILQVLSFSSATSVVARVMGKNHIAASILSGAGGP